MIKIKELFSVDQRFSRLKVIDLDPIIIDRRQQIRVECDCGNQFYTRPDRLLSGRTTACFYCAFSNLRNKCTVYYGDICSKYFNDIKRNAKVRSLEFNITMRYIWELYLKQNKKCALSGLDITLKKFSTHQQKFIHKEISASLDRINSEKGYTEDNVQWVHKWVNVMKGAMSNEHFVYLCNKIAENNNFEYENFEPSLMNGWLPRYTNSNRNQKGAETNE